MDVVLPHRVMSEYPFPVGGTAAGRLSPNPLTAHRASAGLSDRLKVLTQEKQPLRSVPQLVQRGLAQSIFDSISRIRKPGVHPLTALVSAARPSTFGGDNLKELARRGLTKIGGVVTLGAAAWDLTHKDSTESWGHALTGDGSHGRPRAAARAGPPGAGAYA